MAADFEDSQERIAAAAARSAEFQNMVRDWNMRNQVAFLPGILGQGKATADFYTNQPRTMFVSDRFQPQGVQEYQGGNLADIIPWTGSPEEGDGRDDGLAVEEVAPTDPVIFVDPGGTSTEDGGNNFITTPEDLVPIVSEDGTVDSKVVDTIAGRGGGFDPRTDIGQFLRGLDLNPTIDIDFLTEAIANSTAGMGGPDDWMYWANKIMGEELYKGEENPTLVDDDMRGLVTNPTLVDEGMRGLVTNPTLVDEGMRGLVTNPTLVDEGMRGLVTNPTLVDEGMRGLVTNPTLLDEGMRGLVTNPTLVDDDMRGLVTNPTLVDDDMRGLVTNPTLLDEGMRGLVTNPTLLDEGMRGLATNPTLLDDDMRGLATNPTLLDEGMRGLVTNPTLLDEGMRGLVTNPTLLDEGMRGLVTDPTMIGDDLRGVVTDPTLLEGMRGPVSKADFGVPNLEGLMGQYAGDYTPPVPLAQFDEETLDRLTRQQGEGGADVLAESPVEQILRDVRDGVLPADDAVTELTNIGLPKTDAIDIIISHTEGLTPGIAGVIG